MDAAKTLSALRELDELACRETIPGRLNSLTHLLTSLFFIVTVTSVPKYEVSALVPYLIYPFAIILIGDIPLKSIMRRVLFVLPLILFLGAFNPLLDQKTVSLGGFVISAGWLSFFCVLLKCVLTILAALILISITGINGICAALSSIGVPGLIVSLLGFTYRYLFVLCEEIVTVLSAYRLRAGLRRGVSLGQFGSLCGGLFLRSVKRADAIASAMRCRGFNGSMPYLKKKNFSLYDFFYISSWCVFFTAARVWNIPVILGNLLLAVIS